jgi:putative sterol carrier protein
MKEIVKFGTLEYFQKIAEACNASESLMKSFMSLTMIYQVTDMILPNGGTSRHYLKFEKGRVVEVREATPTEDADIVYIVQKEIFQRLFTGTLKAEDAMKTGWLKMGCKLGKVLRYKGAMDTYSKIVPAIQAEYSPFSFFYSTAGYEASSRRAACLWGEWDSHPNLLAAATEILAVGKERRATEIIPC